MKNTNTDQQGMNENHNTKTTLVLVTEDFCAAIGTR